MSILDMLFGRFKSSETASEQGTGDQENHDLQGGEDMAFVQHKPQRGEKLQPLDVIEGFQVRSRLYAYPPRREASRPFYG